MTEKPSEAARLANKAANMNPYSICAVKGLEADIQHAIDTATADKDAAIAELVEAARDMLERGHRTQRLREALTRYDEGG